MFLLVFNVFEHYGLVLELNFNDGRTKFGRFAVDLNRDTSGGHETNVFRLADPFSSATDLNFGLFLNNFTNQLNNKKRKLKVTRVEVKQPITSIRPSLIACGW